MIETKKIFFKLLQDSLMLNPDKESPWENSFRQKPSHPYEIAASPEEPIQFLRHYRQTYVNIPAEEPSSLERPRNNNILQPDYSIKIPSEVASKAGLKIGDHIAVNILDEDNCEIVISKKFIGIEAKSKFRALRDSLYDSE